jgi:hypothetical protein
MEQRIALKVIYVSFKNKIKSDRVAVGDCPVVQAANFTYCYPNKLLVV